MDWDQYLKNLEASGGRVIGPSTSAQDEANRQRTLQSLEAAIAPIPDIRPKEGETSIPGLFGMAAGVIPFVAPQSRFGAAMLRLGEAGPAVTRPFVPSLAGSAVGTSVGNLVEAGATGKNPLSSEFGKRLLQSNIENAVFDVGGNLAFSLGGKLFKVGKDSLKEIGFSKGVFDDEESAARKAAQEWFSSRGATLTRGQLTGNVSDQAIEGAMKYTSGATSFAEQQKKVAEALQKGSREVLDTLEVSDAFKAALIQGDPTKMAVGDRFQNAIDVAQSAMKDKYRPIYEQMEQQGDGLIVDIRNLKSDAQIELDRLSKTKFAGAGAEKKRALEDILKQDDEISFSVAHDLRSNLLAGAREAKKDGVATTVLEGSYNKYAQGLRNQMDSVAVITFGNEEEKALARKLGLLGGIDQPAGLRSGQYTAYNIDDLKKMNLGRTKATTGNNALLRDYWNAQESYASGMQGFYNATISQALKDGPSAVGEYLFSMTEPARTRDAFKAIAEAQKYLPKDQAKGLYDELQYGFLSNAFSTPENIANFGKKMQDPEFRKTVTFLFRDSKKANLIKDITNAAQFGTETFAGTTALRTQGATAAIGAAQAAGLGGLAYLVLPDTVTNKIDFQSAVSTAGVLWVTPKFISRALTSKEGADALAMIAKGQNNPKYFGAMSAKIADQLNKSGVIDSEYISEIERKIKLPQSNVAPTQAPTGGVSPEGINWDAYIEQAK
jgi:hypothetical protein